MSRPSLIPLCLRSCMGKSEKKNCICYPSRTLKKNYRRSWVKKIKIKKSPTTTRLFACARLVSSRAQPAWPRYLMRSCVRFCIVVTVECKSSPPCSSNNPSPNLCFFMKSVKVIERRVYETWMDKKKNYIKSTPAETQKPFTYYDRTHF